MRAQLLIALLLASATCALAACAGDKADTNSPDYSAGYGDGCATGQAGKTYPPQPPVRDSYAFNHSVDYKSGWRAGYNACLVRRDSFGP